MQGMTGKKIPFYKMEAFALQTNVQYTNVGL